MSPTLRLNRPLKYDTFPHKCALGELDFWIEEFAIDDDDAIEPENDRIIDLEEYSGWSEIEFTLTVEVPKSLLTEVFPTDDEDGDSTGSFPGDILVAGRCIDTYTRAGKVLNRGSPVTKGQVSGTLKVESENVAGTLSLYPYLLRSEPLTDADVNTFGLDSAHDYATKRGTILSDGLKCTIKINDEVPGRDDVLLTERTSFEEENEDEDSPFPPANRMYYLDLKRDPDNPVLYFNEDHSRIVDMLWNGDGQYDELTEDLVWDHVMSSVWSRMVQVAAKEYDPEADTWTPEWQPAVFEMLSEHLYPDEDRSPQKAAEFLQDTLNEDTMTATERIEDAVQGLLEPARQFENHASRVGDR